MRYNFLEFPFGRYINQELLAQRSMNYELGVVNKFNPKLKVDLTGFLINIKDEIYLNPLTYTNENYERTERRGIELSWIWTLVENIHLFGNYTFIEAIFDKGEFADNHVPAVPVHKSAIGLNWKISQHWYINGLLNYVGKRYFISDQSNSYPRMDEFITLDIKVSYKLSDAVIFLGINNVFGDRYSEYGAISTMFNERGYYPSPERNFFAGCSFKF